MSSSSRRREDTHSSSRDKEKGRDLSYRDRDSKNDRRDKDRDDDGRRRRKEDSRDNRDRDRRNERRRSPRRSPSPHTRKRSPRRSPPPRERSPRRSPSPSRKRSPRRRRSRSKSPTPPARQTEDQRRRDDDRASDWNNFFSNIDIKREFPGGGRGGQGGRGGFRGGYEGRGGGGFRGRGGGGRVGGGPGGGGRDGGGPGGGGGGEFGEDEKPIDREMPNFGLSGKLTEETNSYKGIVIKYSEPPEARKPIKIRWRLYPFKEDQVLETMYIHRQSAYLLGRERKVADIPIDHPSCSKQHAVIQYRLVPYERKDGSSGRRIRPYIIDLESANGTFVNGKKIEARRYVELLEKDVLKFGFSSREYVLLHEMSKEETEAAEAEEEMAIKQEPPSPPPE